MRARPGRRGDLRRLGGRRDGLRTLGEVAPLGDRPLVVGLDQHGAHQAKDRRLVRAPLCQKGGACALRQLPHELLQVGVASLDPGAGGLGDVRGLGRLVHSTSGTAARAAATPAVDASAGAPGRRAREGAGPGGSDPTDGQRRAMSARRRRAGHPGSYPAPPQRPAAPLVSSPWRACAPPGVARRGSPSPACSRQRAGWPHLSSITPGPERELGHDEPAHDVGDPPPAEARLGESRQDRLPNSGEALAGEGLHLEGAGGVAHLERRPELGAPGRPEAVRSRG